MLDDGHNLSTEDRDEVEAVQAGPDDADEMPFLVVGVGASAGGLQAISSLLRAVPEDTRMAFVVITHQEPGRDSMLPELLAREASIPVLETVDGMEVEPGHVYVAAAGSGVVIRDGRLFHPGPETGVGRLLPVDAFLRSLAHDCGERAVAVILSGSGSDGALGVREVKGGAGLVLAQDPDTAGHDSMPCSAIDTGAVDHVLPPAGMIDLLCGYGRLHRPRAPEPVDDMSRRIFGTIVDAVHARTGRDFSPYKPSTIRRRIAHRMAIQQIARPELYLKFLLANPEELELLFRDLLIGVTSFFRDPEAWQVLGDAAADRLLPDRTPDDVLRVWVPGCSTGEEAYSLAMLLRDRITAGERQVRVSVFATDLDDAAIATARYGLYPAGIRGDVDDERLNRYFTLSNSSYQVRRHLRDLLVFAPHDLLSDPPFTRLDLVSCRNVLIYLQPDMQQRVLRLLHYALKPGGLLFLGSSETVGEAGGLFDVLDSGHRIYCRKEAPGAANPLLPLRSSTGVAGAGGAASRGSAAALSEARVADLVEGTLARLYVPVAAVVNERAEVFYLHGATGKVLQPSRGRPRNSLLAMARDGLEPAVASALREAASGDRPVARRRARVRTDGEHLAVEVEVRRLDEPAPLRGLLLVVIRPVPPPPGEAGDGAREPLDGEARMALLEQDLEFTRESLQGTVEELQTSNEELRSVNEELQSANEELQSSNEELEASKEEMQSLNEELTTVNVELQSKVDELSQVNDDMMNLLDSTDIATLFLDEQLRIQRFSKQATEIVRVIASDVGRHLGDLKTRLEDEDLVGECEQVLLTLQTRVRDVATTDGRWYQLKIMPYRTVGDEVEGLVVTFVDITRLCEAEQVGRRQADESSRVLSALLGLVEHPVAVLDDGLRVEMANAGFAEAFGGVDAAEPGALEGRPFGDGQDGGWGTRQLRRFLKEALAADEAREKATRAAVVTAADGRELRLTARRLELAGRRGACLVVALGPLSSGTDADG